MLDTQEKYVISIFVEAKQAEVIDQLIYALNPTWKHLSITGPAAQALINTGEQLRSLLDKRLGTAQRGEEILEQVHFSQKVVDSVPILPPNTRSLVISPSLVPFDMVGDNIGMWGERYIFSYVLLNADLPLSEFTRHASKALHRTLHSTQLPITTYLLICPMKMDRFVPRHQQDIITVASALENRLAIEIWLQPTLHQAEQAFHRKDVSWLHVDTHGDRTGQYWMLGPTREGGQLVAADKTPKRIHIPLVLAVGCALNANYYAVGSTLFHSGVQSVVGPCVIFQSLGIANSEEGEANWYRTFFSSLLSGKDTGQSLLEARQATQTNGLLKYAWLIFGSSLLSFIEG